MALIKHGIVVQRYALDYVYQAYGSLLTLNMCIVLSLKQKHCFSMQHVSRTPIENGSTV